MNAINKVNLAVSGILASFALVSCANSSKTVENKITIEATQSVKIIFEETSINRKIDSFEQALKNRGSALTESDWALHDELLDTYIALKSQAINPSILMIPAQARLFANLPSFCLDPNLASPSTNEAFKWHNESPGLSYFKDLIDLKSKGEVSQEKIQTIIWNLKKKTFFESYPQDLKTILLKIDQNAAKKLPSRLADTIKTSALDIVKSQLPIIDEVQDLVKTVEGEFEHYADISKEIRNHSSKYKISKNPELERLPGTDVFAGTKSNDYSSQEVTFHNPTSVDQTIDLNSYYLKSSRRDVQRIALSAPLFSNRKAIADRLEGILYGSMLRLGIGLVPFVNDVADVAEVLTGKDFITGEKLLAFERALSGVGVIAGSGAGYRYAKRAIFAPEKYVPQFERAFEKAGARAAYKVEQTAGKEVLEASGNSIREARQRGKLRTYSAEEANRSYPGQWRPPYMKGTKVVEFLSGEGNEFVRVHGPNNQVGDWLVRKESVRGLSPEMIRTKLSLPKLPSHVSDVHLPAGTPIRRGRIEANYGGRAGAVQYQLLEKSKESWFSKRRPIDEL